MTRWLRLRLGVLLGAAALGGGATFLHAQSAYPAPPKTPEEAATTFYQLMGQFASSRERRTDVYFHIPPNLISRAQIRAATAPGRESDFLSLLLLLASERDQPQYQAQVTGKNGSQTVVSVVPSTSKRREVVVVPEDGGFRVDLKATFGQWNNLSGRDLDEAWFRYTHVVSPSLASDDNFLRSQCQSNLKQVMLGVLQYAQDWDEKLPPARKWQDALLPYLKDEQIYSCPALVRQANGYAFNPKLSQLSQSKIGQEWRTISFYETSNPNRNTFGLLTGRAYRHLDGMNLAFADGHVKWLRREFIEDQNRSMSNAALKLEP